MYAGSGNPENYDWLEAQGIDLAGKIALVRYSVPYSYRGFKALTAQRRGLAGILIYSDPADDGYAKGKTYPDGPWGPESHIQRGGIPYRLPRARRSADARVGVGAGRRRIAAADAVSIPKIISVPMSYRDARVILEALGGPEVPAAWRGALPIAYRAGGRGAAGAPAWCESTAPSGRSRRSSAASAARDTPTRRSSSATTAMRGCSGASIRRADPPR